MFLSAYTGLISHLPYLDQAFETKRGTWVRKEYEGCKEFNLFLNSAFSRGNVISFSRQDLFNSADGDIKTAFFSIILWGYPRNMRGNTFRSILTALPDIEKMFSESRQLDRAGFSRIRQQLKGNGIGLSTLTKFLYFLGFSLDGYRCLILDRRIVDVFNAGTFAELTMPEPITEHNKEKVYPDYLRLMHRLSEKNGYPVDQLELFLFQFGRNLKTASM